MLPPGAESLIIEKYISFAWNLNQLRTSMKNVTKVVNYGFATALIVVLSILSALAADNNKKNTLSGGQVIVGLVLLVAAILVPTIRSVRKAKA
jgi:predicted transporter